jgi:Uncharacterised protein family (UPF0236)
MGRCPVGAWIGHGGGRKRGLQAAFTAEIVAEIEALIGTGQGEPWDLEAIESAARREALRVAARAIEGRFNADHSDEGGPRVACSCGDDARYVERRAKTFVSVLGPLRLERAYYHCATCGRGFCPRDCSLGLERSSLSPALTRMVGLVGSITSFQEGSELLWELASVRVEAKQVERVSEALGREVAEEERTRSEMEVCPTAATMYLGMDGTGVPMRPEELVGCVGKQPDGTSKTREAKLCAVWTADSRNEKGHPVRDDGSVSYSAGIESAATRDVDMTPSAFAERVLREAHRRGFDHAKRQVVMGDGAPWIWKLAEMYFPGATEIVDRYHVKEHLSSVGKALYGPTSPLAHAWTKRRHAELARGDLNGLLRALRRQAYRSPDALNCITYIEINRHRMDYPRFEAAGLCTSTAVVESGCKLTVWTRFKRSGMHWTRAGANAILALRCSRLSGRFESFWERRRMARAAA